jgi:hypothetical protein
MDHTALPRLVKWMFLFWVATIGTLIALQRLN